MTPTPPLKLHSYCAALYDRFYEESEVDTETKLRLWRGHVTKTAKDVGLPNGTYRRVLDALTELKCIEQIERGFRGNAFSVIVLHRAPTPEVWDQQIRGRNPLTRPESSAILSRRLEDLERRLNGIDLKKALVDLQQQISKLQDDVNKFSDGNTQGEKK